MSGGGEAMLYPYRPAGEHRLPGLRKPASLGRGGTGERLYRLQGMRAEGSTATKALGLNDSAPHR